ncbi:MAG: S-layer homology domain-containing protein [Oscillospiraceae bacterium]
MTFLWRAAGKPTVSGSTPFVDVDRNAYYAQAVAWAVGQGITAGTTATTFSPNAPCTRAQSVCFLWRYFGSPPG